jgi:hypothetical protein
MLSKILKKIFPRVPYSKYGAIINKSIEVDPVLGSAIAVIGGGLLYAALHGNNVDPNKWIPASKIGYKGSTFINAITPHKSQESIQTLTGTYVHSIIEKEFGTSGAQGEVYTESPELGVRGYIDILLPNNTPVEVKTISHKGFENLTAPINEHVSQLNYYLYARKANYGYLLYVDSQDLSKRKRFPITYQPGRLAADVREARISLFKQQNQPFMQYMQQNQPIVGIRHSAMPNSFQSMNNDRGDFKKGRVASIVQAKRYRNLSQIKEIIPTMGMTVRSHQVAIQHHRRTNRVPIQKGTHPVRSRVFKS